MRKRIWVEGFLALAAAVLAIVTAISPAWIERLTGVDPDRGSGALEWAVVIGLALCSVIAAAVAGRDIRRWRIAGATPPTS